MPVTKTAKRALRGSKNKESVNKAILSKLGVAIRIAKNSKKLEKVLLAVSLADRAAKKKVIHPNKAGRIKSQMARLLPVSKKSESKPEKASKVTVKKAK